jgi:hypothetical protein
MAKSTKKEQPRVVKPITDFFQRIPSSSQASGVSDSASIQPRPKGEAATKHSTQSAPLSKHSASQPLKRSSTSNSRVESSPHRPTTISPRKPMESQRLKAPLFRTASLKRPRSPEGPKASNSPNRLTDKRATQASQVSICRVLAISCLTHVFVSYRFLDADNLTHPSIAAE